MFDAVLIETLYQIKQALERIINRFEPVEDVDFFLDSEEGLEKLDGICMQLIAIGESLKHIDKLTDKELLQQYPQINWKDAKGIRDIISHHYFDLDAEAIFDVCENDIKPMHLEIMKIIGDIQKD